MSFKETLLVLCLIVCLGLMGSPVSGAAQASAINDEQQEDPKLQIAPSRLDFGIIAPNQSFSRIINITNAGKHKLKWHGALTKEGASNKTGRFFSLINDDVKGSGQYRAAAAYQDLLELSGRWTESDGYPGLSQRSILKFHFTGTGIRLCYWKEPENGRYSVYINKHFVTEIDAHDMVKERANMVIAQQLPFGTHILTIVGKEGKASLEGFEVYGKSALKGPVGYLRLLPSSGETTKEIDYVSLVVNTQRMAPGTYGDLVTFTSNGGTIAVPISFEIMAETVPKTLIVYRYAAGNDYLFTTNPQADEPLIQARRYVKEGIAFRLFTPGKPGVVEFYRWYNPVRKSHFYSYHKNDGGKLERDYIYEGSIGHIATTRLKNTRELYRWFHPRFKMYFYSTDIKGNEIQRKGYQFDGIAGYVK